jgi:hypothetical protein
MLQESIYQVVGCTVQFFFEIVLPLDIDAQCRHRERHAQGNSFISHSIDRVGEKEYRTSGRIIWHTITGRWWLLAQLFDLETRKAPKTLLASSKGTCRFVLFSLTNPLVYFRKKVARLVLKTHVTACNEP